MCIANSCTVLLIFLSGVTQATKGIHEQSNDHTFHLWLIFK